MTISTSEKMQKRNGQASEPELRPTSELVNLLGIEFSLSDFVENARGNWRSKFLNDAGKLRDWILLAVPDAAGIETLDETLCEAERGLKRKSMTGILGLSKCCQEYPDPDSETAILGQVAEVYFLPELIQIDPQAAWDFVQRLTKSMHEPIDHADQNPLRFFCAAIEIPLVISASLRRLERGHAIGSEAIITFGVFLERFFDENGWFAPQYLSQLGPLVVAILRARHLIKLSKHPVPEKIQERFEWIGRQVLRMMKADGQLTLTDGWIRDPEFLIRAIERVTKDSDDAAIARFLLKRSGKQKSPSFFPEASDYSESGHLGVLRPNWRRKSPRVALAEIESGLDIELGAGVSLLRGDNMPRLSMDGDVVNLASSSFTLNCWETNDEVVFLELERSIPDAGVIWQRQFIVSREDEFVIVADACLLDESAQTIEYELEFPLAEGIEAQPEAETREIYLKHADKITALAIPLSLGEWKSDRSGNHCLADGERLLLNQRGRGRGLYAAMAFDLSPRRAKRPRTWRRLTVAENLQIVNHDIAVAFRLQLGNQQWLLYRSLAPVGNRTFLGQNVYCEFCFGAFDSDGNLDKQVMIE